jgi:putative PIN family toxin of toxin-antitoxin system
VRVVIDTNCLIASIPKNNPEFWLYEAFNNQEFEWVISNEILHEYEEILSTFYSPNTANLVISILLTAPNLIHQEPFFKWGLISSDPDDNKFADLAISSNAHYLVSNDRHFQVLKQIPFPIVNIVSLDEFKEVLQK